MTSPRIPSLWKDYAVAVLVIGLATLVAWPIHGRLDPSNLIMVYLLGVVAVATRTGRGAAIFASFLSVAAFDFFFVPPHWTFLVSDSQYIVTFGVMLVVAFVISTLTNRFREQADAARRRERRTTALLMLSRELSSARELNSLLQIAIRQVSKVFETQTVLLMPGSDGKLVVRASDATTFQMDEKELGVAHMALDHNRASGASSGMLAVTQGLYLPLVGSRGTVGVLGVVPNHPGSLNDAEQLILLEAFASQSASAMERVQLAEEARTAWERVEAEFMRNTLLSSVSHDLRTPLAAITGAASTLVAAGPSLAEEERKELAVTIGGESERMARLIHNLLDMTRLESGGLQLNREWLPLQEVIGSTLHHMDARLAGRQVIVQVPADLPLLQLDAVSFEQVLNNLIDNALQYTPTGSPIEVTARANPQHVIIEIADNGPGIPAGTEQQVFQKFFRAHATGDRGRRGIGLGLAIAKGIVEAHGGIISARNKQPHGAVFQIALPLSQTPPAVDVHE